jgi:two-component system, NtrC family, sensor histidine kinase HydH
MFGDRYYHGPYRERMGRFSGLELKLRTVPAPIPTHSESSPRTVARWRRFVRPQDLVWLLFFSALAKFGPEQHPLVLGGLLTLGLVQVLEPRIGAITSIVLELGLCFLIIGKGGGISSSYFVVLFLPVMSAGTNFGLLGAALGSLAAAAVYLSFWLLLPLDQYVPPDQIPEIVLRAVFFPVVGFLTYQLAAASRSETRKAQAAAEQLAEANRSLKEAQAQVRRTERVAALGQLTAGLAHELRNPLGTMKTSAEMLTRSVAQENEIAREMAGFITSEVDRTNSLITRFLDFARPQHMRLESGDVHAMLDQAIARFAHENPARGVSVIKNYSPDVLPVRFDAELMERVILNLISNAAQASPPGSVVTVKTRVAEPNGKAMVEISVIDSGSGIDAKNLENIFNPFFTTKAEGVGLGLAICSKIVDDHGGSIAVESTPGEGSVFRVYLPMGE